MDTTRIFRFTVPGWAFLLFTALQSWILGNQIVDTIRHFTTGPANILVGLAAGPVIGFLISAFVYQVVQRYCPDFAAPPSGAFDHFQNALRSLAPWRSGLDLETILASGPWTTSHAIRNRDTKLRPIFNLIIHTRAPISLIEYTTRRWTMFWMYANTIGALLFSTVLAFGLSGPFWQRSPDWLIRVPIEIVLLVFALLGIRSMISLRKEILQIAWLWLYQEAGNQQADLTREHSARRLTSSRS